MTLIWPSVTLAVANARRTAQVPLIWDPVGHVLSRMAFGPTASSRAVATQLGISAWFHNQPARRGQAGLTCQRPTRLPSSLYKGREYRLDGLVGGAGHGFSRPRKATG
ncbi:MAG: hypothetical protein ABI808_08270 [Pseudonocardiales bacterium]